VLKKHWYYVRFHVRVLGLGLESSFAVLGLVFEYCRAVLVLGLDLRLPVLVLGKGPKAVLIPSLGSAAHYYEV